MNEYLTYRLAKKLLIIPAPKGFLACAYINTETCNKTEEACAIVSGVDSYNDMNVAKVVSLSHKVEDLGVKIGDTGQEALDKMA